VQSIGLRRVQVETVRVGLGHDRREVLIADGPVPRRAPIEREVLRGVVADRELVVLSEQPTVARAVRVLRSPAFPRMIGIRMCAALELAQVVRHVFDAGRIAEREAGLSTVGTGQPSEEVVERAVLHHHDDDVIDARSTRQWQLRRRG
jgi:hypothetical protein